MSDYTYCRHCGIQRRFHGGANNPHRPFACPAKPGDVKFPITVEKRKGMAAAQDAYAKRLDKHWTKRTTSFESDHHVPW